MKKKFCSECIYRQREKNICLKYDSVLIKEDDNFLQCIDCYNNKGIELNSIEDIIKYCRIMQQQYEDIASSKKQGQNKDYDYGSMVALEILLDELRAEHKYTTDEQMKNIKYKS